MWAVVHAIPAMHANAWLVEFIVPENILESNPALVVMDLGNFRLKTVVAEDAPATLDEEGGISSRC